MSNHTYQEFHNQDLRALAHLTDASATKVTKTIVSTEPPHLDAWIHGTTCLSRHGVQWSTTAHAFIHPDMTQTDATADAPNASYYQVKDPVVRSIIKLMNACTRSTHGCTFSLAAPSYEAHNQARNVLAAHGITWDARAERFTSGVAS